jgi:hypothetical protein
MCLTKRYTNLTRRISNETQRHADHRVSALDTLVTFHLADDIIRGMEKGGVSTLVAVPILVVWLYGTLVLAERRSGYVIILLGSLLGLAVPVIHMMGKGVGVGSNIANSSGAFFFVWTLLALGVTALFSVILSVRGLWSPQWGQSR